MAGDAGTATAAVQVAIVTALGGVLVAAIGAVSARVNTRRATDEDRRAKPRGRSDDLVTLLVNDLRRALAEREATVADLRTENADLAEHNTRLLSIVEEHGWPTG